MAAVMLGVKQVRGGDGTPRYETLRQGTHQSSLDVGETMVGVGADDAASAA